jgi:hypothetical protein
MKMNQPNLDDAVAFATALTGGSNGVPSSPLRFRLIHDTQRNAPAREFQGDVRAVWPSLMAAQGQGYAIYYFVNEVFPDLPGHAKDENVMRVRAIPADFDKGIPNDWEWHVKPDLLVHTSITDGVQRGQALWLPKEEVPLAQFKPLCQQVIETYGSDPAVCNLSRILRLPGTLHLKDKPQLVTWRAL